MGAYIPKQNPNESKADYRERLLLGCGRNYIPKQSPTESKDDYRERLENRQIKFERKLLKELIIISLIIILCAAAVVVVAKIANNNIEITVKK